MTTKKFSEAAQYQAAIRKQAARCDALRIHAIDLTVERDALRKALTRAVEYFDANGGSDATVSPSGRLDAVAMGGSHITYLGSPTLGTIDTDSTSTVKQK